MNDLEHKKRISNAIEKYQRRYARKGAGYENYVAQLLAEETSETERGSVSKKKEKRQ